MHLTQNPIREPVTHFVPAAGFRRKRKKKAPKKSSFVKFFESLENRGPDKPSPYETWTKNIRRDMEAAGTWPTGKQKPSLTVVAKYISRLQAQVWKDNPGLAWNEVTVVVEKNYSQLKPYLLTFERIFLKIRQKGMRDKSFRLAGFRLYTSVSWTYVLPWFNWPRDQDRNIFPYPCTGFQDRRPPQ